MIFKYELRFAAFTRPNLCFEKRNMKTSQYAKHNQISPNNYRINAQNKPRMTEQT